jgi:hypothetical protein
MDGMARGATRFAKKQTPSPKPVPFNIGAGMRHRIREFWLNLSRPGNPKARGGDTMTQIVTGQQESICVLGGTDDGWHMQSTELSGIFDVINKIALSPIVAF